MNKRMYINTLMILIVGFPMLSQGQNDLARQDLLQINQAVLKYPQQDIQAEYRLYAKHFAKQPAQTMAVISKRDGALSYHRLEEIEALNTGSYNIMVYHQDKVMLIEENTHSVEQLILGFDVEQALNICTAINAIEAGKGIKAYALELPHNEVERLDVYFDTKTYLIQKLVLFYRNPQKLLEERDVIDKPRLELVYLSINTSPEFLSNTFAETRFIEQKNGTFIPAAPFQDYQLIDNTKRN